MYYALISVGLFNVFMAGVMVGIGNFMAAAVNALLALILFMQSVSRAKES